MTNICHVPIFGIYSIININTAPIAKLQLILIGEEELLAVCTPSSFISRPSLISGTNNPSAFNARRDDLFVGAPVGDIVGLPVGSALTVGELLILGCKDGASLG